MASAKHQVDSDIWGLGACSYIHKEPETQGRKCTKRTQTAHFRFTIGSRRGLPLLTAILLDRFGDDGGGRFGGVVLLDERRGGGDGAESFAAGSAERDRCAGQRMPFQKKQISLAFLIRNSVSPK